MLRPDDLQRLFGERVAPDGTLARERFAEWFGGSRVVDEHGLPQVVYRGEHGVGAEDFHSRLNSLTFGSALAASTYALSPNCHSDVPVAARVLPAYLRIANPIFELRDDPFIELSLLESRLGRDEALRIAIKFDDHIQHTGNWDENFSRRYSSVRSLLEESPEKIAELYFVAYVYLDDDEEVARLKAAGFDGAIHVGSGETATELEYRVFDKSSVTSAIGNDGSFELAGDTFTGRPRAVERAQRAIALIRDQIHAPLRGSHMGCA